MELSARTLREVEFSGSLRGYNTDEVDEFLEKVAVAVEALQAEVRAARERAEEMERRLADQPPERPAAPDDDPIRRTLMLAQRTADLAVKEAQEEAAQIVTQARADAEAAIADARRTAERISEEGQQHLREEVLHLTSVRDGLRSEADTLVGLLGAERERLRESLGAALRFVERSLTPAKGLSAPPASAPPTSAPPASSPPASSPSASAPSASSPSASAPPTSAPEGATDVASLETGGTASGPVPAANATLEGGARPEKTVSSRLEEASTQAATPRPPEAGQLEARREAGDGSGRLGGMVSPGSVAPTRDVSRSGTAEEAGAEPVASILTDTDAPARQPLTGGPTGVVVAREPMSWLDDEQTGAGRASPSAMGEYDEWDLDDGAPTGGPTAPKPAPVEQVEPSGSTRPEASEGGRLERSATGRSPLVAGTPAAERTAGPAAERTVGPAAERTVGPAAASSQRARASTLAEPPARPWAGDAEVGGEEDELDELEAAIAEDAAAAAPVARGYDDEFSWEARRSLRRSRATSREGEADRSGLTALPGLDDTMQDAVVWQMKPSGPDSSA